MGGVVGGVVGGAVGGGGKWVDRMDGVAEWMGWLVLSLVP